MRSRRMRTSCSGGSTPGSLSDVGWLKEPDPEMGWRYRPFPVIVFAVTASVGLWLLLAWFLMDYLGGGRAR